jgi:4-hydroxythreonine-4-phosphate dehydrogenase
MMLWSEAFAVVPVTVHIPLREVPAALTLDLIVETGRIVAYDLRRRFGHHGAADRRGRPQPSRRRERHARDRGPRRSVAPAIERLRAEGLR